MKIKTLFFIFILITIVFAQFPLNDVPLNHPVYEFVEELSTTTKCAFHGINQKPYKFEDVKKYLLVILERYPQKITDLQKQKIYQFLNEFHDEKKSSEENKWKFYPVADYLYSKMPFLKWFYRDKWDFYTYNKDKLTFRLNPQMRLVKYQSRNNSTTTNEMRISTGYVIEGAYAGNLGFYWNLLDNSFEKQIIRPERNVWKDSGYPFITNSENSIQWDENIFFVTFNWKGIDFLAGRNFLVWGPGERDHIILSTNSPAFDQLKLRFTSKYVDYTVVTGKLFAPVDSIQFTRDMPDKSKYLAAQRVDIYPFPFLQIGWTQMIVYANRNVVVGYNLPFSFFKSSEHYYGDKDNGLMALDIQFFPFRHVNAYFSWLIDDLTTSKIGTDFIGNKFAFQYGLKLLDMPLWKWRSDWFVEYIKIDPYVYSHRYGNETEFKHYDSHLGSFLEPNSDMVYLKHKMRFTSHIQFISEFEYIRHGANLPDYNAGGSVDESHGDHQGYQPFLSGKREYTTRVFATINYEYFYRSNFFITLAGIKNPFQKWTTDIWVGLSFSFGYRPYQPIYRF